jgi:hypothetical protein
MKKIFTAILSCLITASNILGQNYYLITFDGIGYNEFGPGHHLFIDYASTPLNVWQIGQPQKSVFTNSVATSKAIVTNTLTSYPVNNTSSFVLCHVANAGFFMPCWARIGGKYYVNSDSLTDYGKIEFSPDNGGTWIDLITNTTYSNSIFWNNPYVKPTLTGNSNGWKRFKVNIEGLGPIFNIQSGDTVRWRFTFTSDGIQTNKDGLMFDSIDVVDVPPVDLRKLNTNQLLTRTFPNPSQNTINIEFDNNGKSDYTLVVYNNLGQAVFEKNIPQDEKIISIDVTDFDEGLYSYIIASNSDNNSRSGKFIRKK